MGSFEKWSLKFEKDQSLKRLTVVYGTETSLIHDIVERVTCGARTVVHLRSDDIAPMMTPSLTPGEETILVCTVDESFDFSQLHSLLHRGLARNFYVFVFSG